jgi:hypothetical protein
MDISSRMSNDSIHQSSAYVLRMHIRSCFNLATLILLCWICHNPLPENPCLPCAKIFAVCFFRAHGKELICRVFYIERTAKKKRTTNKLFAVRSKKNARQRFCLPCVFSQTTFSPLPRFKQMKCGFFKKKLCRAFFRGARQTHEFAMGFSEAHSKHTSLPCALFHTHGKIFFYFP